MFCGKKAGMLRPSKQIYRKKKQRKIVTRTLTTEALASAAMTWQQAELVALDWMTKHGYRDAKLTPPGADGGIDITSRAAVAQVKHHTKPIGLAEMQRISGIAQSLGKQALFFSSSGYTPKARTWANQHKIRLHEFPPVRQVN